MFTVTAHLLLSSLSLSASPPTLSLPAGYYSLKDLAKRSSDQGIPVTVEPGRSQDIYALSLNKVSWTNLRAALAADGRLNVTETQEGWRLASSPSQVARENGMLRTYMATLRGQAHRVLGRAESESRYIANATPEQQEKAIHIFSIAREGDPLLAAGNQLIHRYAGARDLPFYVIAVASRFFQPTQPLVFGTWLYSNAFESRHLIEPRGDMRTILKGFRIDPSTLSDQGLAATGRQIQMAAKLRFEPVSASMVGTLLFYDNSKTPVQMSMPVDIVPGWFRFNVPASAVISKEDAPRYASRQQRTSTESALPASRKQASTEKAFRVSGRLLAWAKGSGSDLIYYVSPYTDYSTTGAREDSLQRLVAEVNAPAFRATPAEPYMESVLGTPVPPQPPALALPVKLTLARANGVIVVRNELRFLDGLCLTPTVPSVGIANALMAGRQADLIDLARIVSQLDMKKWATGLYSTHYADLCDPIAFRPFAAAMIQSPKLRETILSSKPGTSLSLKFSALDSAAASVLRRELVAMAPLYGARSGIGQDPLFTKLHLEQKGTGDLTVVVQKNADAVTFDLVIGEASTVWRATVRKVSQGESK